MIWKGFCFLLLMKNRKKTMSEKLTVTYWCSRDLNENIFYCLIWGGQGGYKILIIFWFSLGRASNSLSRHG